MPDIYISYAGIKNKQMDEKFAQTELGEIKEDLARRDREDEVKNQEFHQLKKKYDSLIELLQEYPSKEELKAAIQRLKR